MNNQTNIKDNLEEQLDEILEELDTDFHHYHDGPWDYNGPKPIEKAKQSLLHLIETTYMDTLDEYNKFLQKWGYTDSDVELEEPTAINRFLKERLQ